MADPDLWGHVQYGRDALRHGLPRDDDLFLRRPRAIPGSTTKSSPSMCWRSAPTGSAAPGLLIGKCLLGVAIVGAIMWRALQAGREADRRCAAWRCSWRSRWATTGACGRRSLPTSASRCCSALLSYCFEGWEGTLAIAAELAAAACGNEPPLRAAAAGVFGAAAEAAVARAAAVHGLDQLARRLSGRAVRLSGLPRPPRPRSRLPTRAARPTGCSLRFGLMGGGRRAGDVPQSLRPAVPHLAVQRPDRAAAGDRRMASARRCSTRSSCRSGCCSSAWHRCLVAQPQAARLDAARRSWP